MTGLIIISALLFFSARTLISGARQARLERVQREQKEELRRQMEEAKKAARERIELAKEQIRLAEEQAKQAEKLEKHEARLTKMEFALEKAEYDISFLTDRILSLTELLDMENAARREAKPGSKQEQASVKRIMGLQNQLHTANVKLGKARFDKEQAEKFLQDDVA